MNENVKGYILKGVCSLGVIVTAATVGSIINRVRKHNQEQAKMDEEIIEKIDEMEQILDKE